MGRSAMGSRTHMAPMLALPALLSIGIASASTTPPSQQYTSRAHVLRFNDSGYYVSNGSYALRVTFEHAQSIAARSEAGADPAALGRVSYFGLWDGISVTYDTPPAGILRSTWTLEPGADPAAIRLRYNRAVRLTKSGSMSVSFETGAVSESRPVAWQEVDGKRQAVDVAFIQLGEDRVGFQVGTHRRDLPLTIDPTLTWNTFLGGSSDDYGQEIAVDGNGNVYVAGYSSASWGSPVRPYTAGIDAFAAKLTADGAVAWNTFLGGSSDDYAYGIAVDGNGNVYVGGSSDATWGSPVRPYTPGLAGDDAFAAKLTADGALVWSTFLGGSNSDYGKTVAVDGHGNVYVAGYSRTTWGSPVRAFTGSNYNGFAAKLTAGGALTWNTFLGGTGGDFVTAIAVDPGDNVYVAGYGKGWGTPVRAYTPSLIDAFAAKLTADGALVWNTFLGGSDSDYGSGIAVDGSGNVYVTGHSLATWGSPVRAFTGGIDAFAAKLNTDGALTWNTFLGLGGQDVGLGVAVDGSGNVYVAGYSDATWGSPVNAYTAGDDAFAARLDADGALTWNTFLGGSGDDYGLGIAADANGNVYVTGYSEGAWGSPVRPYTAGDDAFAAQIAEPPTSTSTSTITTSTTETTSSTTSTTESATSTTETTTTTTTTTATTTTATTTTATTTTATTTATTITTTTTTTTTTATTTTATATTTTTETTTSSTTTTTFGGVGHLKCYGGRDSRAKATYTLDLAAGVVGFPSHVGCTLRLGARTVCVEVAKQNVTPAPPGGGPTIPPNTGSVFLSYRLKCPSQPLAPATLSDQFGAGLFTPTKPAELLAPALPGPANDHVLCYKARDARTKVPHTADLLAGVTGFADEIGCTITAGARRVCVQVTKDNVSPPAGGGPGPGPAAGESFIAYKLKCPTPANPPLAVTDQFGAGTFTPFSPRMLLVPAQ